MLVVRILAIVCITISIVAGLAIPISLHPTDTLEFPFVPGLGESIRTIFFHVPLAWTSFLAFLLALFYGIRYLQTSDFRNDRKADAAAGLGVLFCVLATLTGSVWAKVTWGSFWNWDPRETSIVILLLVYGAYYVLRSSVLLSERKARLAAVYLIFSGVISPFFIFILPRITGGLHPGAKGDESGAIPAVQLHMNETMMCVFLISLIGFTFLFLWLFQLRVRVSEVSVKLKKNAGS